MRGCLGHQQCSQLCVSCEKQAPPFETRFKRFMNQWYKTLSNCGSSLNDHIMRPTNIATFWPTKGNHFVLYPMTAADHLGYLNKWRPFGTPVFEFSAQSPGLDLPLSPKQLVLVHILQGPRLLFYEVHWLLQNHAKLLFELNYSL